MIIYVVQRDCMDDENEVLGVFSTPEKAERFKNCTEEKDNSIKLNIVPFEIDEQDIMEYMQVVVRDYGIESFVVTDEYKDPVYIDSYDMLVCVVPYNGISRESKEKAVELYQKCKEKRQ